MALITLHNLNRRVAAVLAVRGADFVGNVVVCAMDRVPHFDPCGSMHDHGTKRPKQLFKESYRGTLRAGRSGCLERQRSSRLRQAPACTWLSTTRTQALLATAATGRS